MLFEKDNDTGLVCVRQVLV